MQMHRIEVRVAGCVVCKRFPDFGTFLRRETRSIFGFRRLPFRLALAPRAYINQSNMISVQGVKAGEQWVLEHNMLCYLALCED